MTDDDLREILAHFDAEEVRLNSDTTVQAAWIAHCFPRYEFDYIIDEMPTAIFTKLWSASQIIRLQTQMDVALACASIMSKSAANALQKNAKALKDYQRGMK